MRRSRVLGTLVVFALAGLVAAGCGSSPPTAASITQGLPSALAGRSVHYVEVTKSGNSSDTITADLSPTDGSVRLVEGKAEYDLIRVSRTIYVRTNSEDTFSALLGFTGNAPGQLLGRWVSVHPGDSAYENLAAEFNLAGQVGAFVPVQPGLRVGAQMKVRSVSVLPVAGTPPASTLAGGTGSASLFVTPTAPYLPVGATLDLLSGVGAVRQHEAVAVAFSRWGEQVRELAPASSVTFKSVAQH